MTVLRETEASLSTAVEPDDGDEQIKCNKCDFNARNVALYESHMKFKHGPKNGHVCNACSKKCSTNEELELHLVDKHQDEIDCHKCNAVFKKEADVYQHASDCSEIIPFNTCTKTSRRC